MSYVEEYLEPSQAITMELFLQKKVNGFSPSEAHSGRLQSVDSL